MNDIIEKNIKTNFFSRFRMASLLAIALVTFSCEFGLRSIVLSDPGELVLETLTIIDRDTGVSVIGDPDSTNDIQTNSKIQIAFNQPLGTLSSEMEALVGLFEEGSPDPVTVAKAVDGNTLTITPERFRYGRSYQVVVKREFIVTNKNRGYSLKRDLTLNFKTSPSGELSLEALAVIDRDTGTSVVGNPTLINNIQTNSEVRLTFNRLLGNLAPEMKALISWVEVGSTPAVITAGIVTDGNTLTITPDRLRYGYNYQLVIKKEFTVTDNGENYSPKNEIVLNFKTPLNGELVLETLIVIDRDTGASVAGDPNLTNNIQTNSKIRLTFNHFLGTLSPDMEALISLVEVAPVPVVIVSEVVASGRNFTITPTRFRYGRSYQVIVKQGFTATDNGETFALKNDLVLNFKTPSEGSLVLESLVIIDRDTGDSVPKDPNIINNIQLNSKIQLTFNQSLGSLSPEMKALISLVEVAPAPVAIVSDIAANVRSLTITPERFSLRSGRNYQLIINKGFTATDNGEKYTLGSDLILNFKTAPNTDNSLGGTYSNGKPLVISGGDVALSFLNTDDISAVAVALVVSEGATLSTGGGDLTLVIGNDYRGTFTTAHDFSGGKTYTYVVTAQNGSSQTYVLRPVIENVTAKEVVSFVITSANNLAAGIEQDLSFVIDETAKSVTASLTNVSVTALVPTIIHSGKNISPASGVAQNFSTDLTYTVTAENDSTAIYTVTLNPYYSVIFDADGGIYPGAAPTNYVRHGGKATDLDSANYPTREGYSFTGWSAASGGMPYSFDTPITSALTLYALWTKNL